MSAYRFDPPVELVQAIQAAKTVAFYTHVNPDGDGLGCEAALAEALRALGKTVIIDNQDPTPAQYEYLGLEALRPGAGPSADLAVALDCPVLERLGKRGSVAFEAAPARVAIDHHVPRTAYAQVMWAQEEAAATAELIESLIAALGLKLTPTMATGLYTALVHDTGCFRHSNADAKAFASGMRLIEAGADRTGVNRRMLDEKPLRMVRLQAHILDHLRVIAGGKAALAAVSAADLAAYGCTWEDTDGISESLRSIAGVHVGAMLRQEALAEAKLSLRSKTDFDVNVLASTWGGGGHAKAAGATLKMGFDEAIAAVSGALEKALA